MKPILLYKPGEITPHGDPILCHFGPGCSIAPHERAAETKTIVIMHGQKFTVKGNWRDIANQAGYGDLLGDEDRAEKRKAAPTGHTGAASKIAESGKAPIDAI